MAYQTNPFLDRSSERTTSDQEFVRLFSPKILERLEDEMFKGAVHIFHSPPGGKTTLLRAFTPMALRAFWNSRTTQDMSEAFQRLVTREIMHEQNGPQMLGVLLSCASGYADLPPGATIAQEGLFRALLDCRVILRSLRNLASLMGLSSTDQLDVIKLDYGDFGKELISIPATSSPKELIHWAEQQERGVYANLDSIFDKNCSNMPTHVRFECVLWLQSVQFINDNTAIYPKRLLMIDDLHKLRNKQRSLLIEELTEIRPSIPVWLAERSIALGDELLAQGSRQKRDLHQYPLENLWNASSKGPYQFSSFAQNILDRRLSAQDLIPSGTFSQYLREQLLPSDIRAEIQKGILKFQADAQRHKLNMRYKEWIAHAERQVGVSSIAALLELYVTRILLSRDEGKQQTSLELIPLSEEERNQRDSSQVQAAAEIFINNELKIPYYFGIERLCILATNNVEELLSLAAALFERLRAKQVLGKQELLLSPQEQEKVIKEAAKQKRDFIPKNHTEGTRAQQLLDAIGSYCREKTFLPNAPIAPGVTGVRLSKSELEELHLNDKKHEYVVKLRRVLAECVAENLFITKSSAESGSRESGTIFYLNRSLCAYYGLPLQMGGWQDITVNELMEWMELGRTIKKLNFLEKF
jgi:hypothetical protein